MSKTDVSGRKVGCQKWWIDYMEGLVEKLRECTWEGALSSGDAMAYFLRGDNCGDCRAVVAEHISQAHQRMKTEIMAAISMVSAS